MSLIGERIKTLREQRNLTRAEVARHVGVSRTAVTKWETGETKNLRLDHLARVGELFGMSADEVMGKKRSARPAWPFEQIDEDAAARMDKVTRDMIEGAMVAIAAQRGIKLAKK